MLITCPKCFTTYDVPAIDDHPEQKVRCIKCGHVWEPALDVIDPLSIDLPLEPSFGPQTPDIPVPSFQDFFQEKEPEKESTRFIGWLKPLYFISLVCIAVSIYLFFFHPEKHAPVTLQTLSYELTEKEYKTYLMLKAAAFNKTDQKIRPQTFTVRFVDEKNRTLTETTVASPVEVLPPRSVEEINIEIERPPSKTAKVILMLEKVKSP